MTRQGMCNTQMRPALARRMYYVENPAHEVQVAFRVTGSQIETARVRVQPDPGGRFGLRDDGVCLVESTEHLGDVPDEAWTPALPGGAR